MSNPIVSIILPTYNGSRYLAQSVQSCIEQSFTDWELIIVNDCSTDNTLEIANQFAAKDGRIRVVENSKNLKLPMSLNHGFSLAVGRFFTWTSDDNFYSKTAIEQLVDALLSNEQYQLVYADETLVDDDGQETGTWIMGDVNHSFASWKGCGGCFLYRREMHEALGGYDPAMFMIEDYDFFLRGYTKFQYKYLPLSNLYYYRFHPASLTGKYMPYVAVLQKLVIEKQLDVLERKIAKPDFALLLRKLCVHYMVNKGNGSKYAFYMLKLRKVSFSQWMLTLCFVPLKGFVRFVSQLIESFRIFVVQVLQKPS